jgi:hypothetical protein
MTEPVLTIVDRLLKSFGCSKDKELLAELNKLVLEYNKSAKFHQPQLSRWRNQGFHTSTELLINLLLDKIESLENELEQKKARQ